MIGEGLGLERSRRGRLDLANGASLDNGKVPIAEKIQFEIHPLPDGRGEKLSILRFVSDAVFRGYGVSEI